ncbi:hypothetical protein C0992_004497 [Termitomyces sp. T32_za158]|nr:hypothetical protein C0992_004497 [Termitomyces sp. T32_za158]
MRRPQVSAENQAMRTGEISKILSKEWNSMETASGSLKEQARLLKDNFNLKYPDYVYRRRPNNTRRKRKPDAPGQRPPDTHPSFSEEVGFDGVGDSPTERDDFHSSEVMSDIHRTRLGHDIHLNEHSKSRHAIARASPYPHLSLDSRSAGHENHLMYESAVGGDHVFHDGPLEQPAHFSYISAQSHGRTQTQPMLIFPQNTFNNDGNWEPSSTHSSSWVGSEPQGRNFSLSAMKTPRSAQSPGNVLSPPPLTLPTLSSPFFPDDSPHQFSPPALAHSISPSSYSPGHISSPILVGREFGQHDISISSVGVPNPGHPYPHSNAERNINGLMYVPGPQRQSGAPRGLPILSDYSLLASQPTFSPHSDSGIQQGYWPKD